MANATVGARERGAGRGAARRHRRDDAFFDGGAGGVQGVLDAGLLLLHLGLGGGADLDHGHAAGQLGQALLQLLAVVVGGGLLDLARICSHAPWMSSCLPRAVDDGGVVLVDVTFLARRGRSGRCSRA
jgi:hypothetical protein